MTDAFFLRFGALVVAVGDVAGEATGESDGPAISFPFGDVDSFLTEVGASTTGAAGGACWAATGAGAKLSGCFWSPCVCCVATPSICCGGCDTSSVALPE
jgi:hypothetical protein